MSDWWNSISNPEWMNSLSSGFSSGNFTPVTAPRDPEKDYLGSTPGGGLGNALYSNRNALVGLGLGLMGGSPGNRFGDALRGYEAGAANDVRAQNVGLTGDIKEYQFAKAQGFKGSFADWQKSQANIKAQYGLNPQWVQKPDGTWAAIQLNSQGQAREVQAPGGGMWSPTGKWINTGTEYQNVPSRVAPYGAGAPTQGPPGSFIQPGAPGQPTTSTTDAEGRPIVPEGPAPISTPPAAAPPATSGGIPINNAGKAAQIKLGQGQGAAQVALPEAIAQADQALSVIDQAKAHPGREIATGWSGLIDPRNIRGAGRDYQVMHKQLVGGVFRQAYETLRGGGHITEPEGEKATKALTRLDLSQSDEDYLAALNDLEQVYKIARTRAIRKSKGDFSPQTTKEDYTPTAKENPWSNLPGGVKIRERL